MGVETVLDVDDYALSASETYAIAIAVSDRQKAGPGTGLLPGFVAASNDDLSILEGTLTNAFHPDAFVGSCQDAPFAAETSLYYDVATPTVPSATGGWLALLAASLIGVAVWVRRALCG